jgi:hypothetical protein
MDGLAAISAPCSVLRHVSRGDIRRDPYPHVVVENCLPAELYDELARTYPADDAILRLSGAADEYVIRQNHRYDLRAHRILRHAGSVAPAWEAFVRYHVSHEFFHEFLNLLGPEIAAVYPGLERRLERPMQEWTTGIRFDPEWDQGQIALDCQIGINTPVTRRGATRAVHTDAPDELFAMLLYFRRDEDRVRGGDLEICRWKAGAARRFVGRDVDPSDTETCSLVPYAANTLVVFINSPESLHAVTPRDPTPISRRLVNIVGRVQRSVPEGLFERPQKATLKALAVRAGMKIYDRTSRRRV